MGKEEIWRDIEGYEGLYEVSNLGRVKSLERIDRSNHLVKEKILKPKMIHTGYLQVGLYNEGKGKWFYVHRLVSQTFIPNLEGLPQINHRDEDKTNNRVDNLEWCTARYNSNYGTHIERMMQTKISNGTYDPELCGIGDRKERDRLWYQKNIERRREQKREYYQRNKDRFRERRTEYMREYRLKKKQEKKKDNRPSETSLW